MEVEPWNALDVDDSDLPSLLRPCKQRYTPSAATVSAVNPPSQQPFAQYQPENQPQQRKQPSPSTSLGPTIPGPAGAVQAAMLRKNLDRESHNFANFTVNENDCRNGGGDAVVSTQEYIRRAMEGTSEFDDDFFRKPWLSALRYLGVDGGVTPDTPISSIRKCIKSGKVIQIVAVIKSSTPNGLGGLMVILKDPTGTVGASIHDKVLSESEFGKNLTVGAVLILQNVSIFAPVRSAQYLNITRRNLLKVFHQDSGAPLGKDNSAHPARYSDLDTEYHREAQTAEKISFMQNIAVEETGNYSRQNLEIEQNIQNDSPFKIQKKILSVGNYPYNDRGSCDASAAVRCGHTKARQDSSNKMPDDVNSSRRICNQHECAKSGGRSEVSNIEGILNSTPTVFVSVSNSGTQNTFGGTRGANEVQIQKQPLMVKSTLGQWTDEQLDELFAIDVDDGSLF